MKALLTIILLGALVIAGINLVDHQRRRTAARQSAALEKEDAASSDSSGPGRHTSDEPRKFDLALQTLYPHGEAIAQAAFYNVSPGVTTSPEKLPPAKSGRTQAGQIYVTGLPDGLVINGPHPSIWLTPAGTKTYIDPQGVSRTIPAYKVIPAPPTVEARPANGAWMYEGATALDQRTKANGLR